MTATTMVASDTWPKSRWILAIIVIMAGQVGLIFWLARHSSPPLPAANNTPHVYLAKGTGLTRPDIVAPALFVLPNQNGFSGNAWMKTAPLQYEPLEWTEPPRPLALSTDKLGLSLSELARTNLAEAFELSSKPEPLLNLTVPPPDTGPANSELSITGDLTRRPLLSKFKLDSWAAPDILSNSVVQVGVDAEGTVFSAILVNEPGELKEAKAADAAALNLARKAQFAPLPRNDSRPANALQWGRLVFHWHTIAPPSTNSTILPP